MSRTPSTFKPDSNLDGVTPQDIQDNCIESRHIAPTEIENKHINDNAIDSRHIVDNAIESRHVESEAIETEHILPGSIEAQLLNLQQGKTVKIGDVSNYTEFESDGTQKMSGNATTWVDIDFPIIIRNVAANRPAITTVKGNLSMPLWTINDYYQFDSQEIIHSYKQGSVGYFHIHVLTNGTDITDRYIRFQFEYNYANVNEAWKSSNIVLDSGDLLIPANTPANTNLVFNLGTINDSNLKIAAHLKARLTRITSTGTAPSNSPFCDMVQIHIEQDTVGSRQIITK